MGFIDPSQLDPETPQSTGGGQFITPDMLDPVKRAGPEDATRVAMGGGLNLLNALTLGFGDEAVGGVNALIDRVSGQSKDIGQAYDERLQQARDLRSEFREEAGPLKYVQDIGGALLMPVPKILKLSKTDPRKIAAAKMALQGGTVGAGYGFGESEGGIEKRLEGAALSGATGAVLSPLIGMPLRSLAGKASKDFQKQALNVQRSDISAANKYAPKGVDKLSTAIEGGRQRGVIKLGPQSADDMLARNTEIIEAQSEKVKALIASADDARVAQNEVAAPTFENAQRFIDKADSGSQPALQAQFNKWLENFVARKWDGSLRVLQEEKQALTKKGYSGLTDSKALDRIIGHDLKVAVEKGAEKFGSKEMANAVKLENAITGEHLTLEKLLVKNKNIENMPQGFAKALRRLFVSPIGGGAAGAYASLMTGNPIPAVLGALGGLATTKGGQLVLSDVARAVANANYPSIIGAASAPREQSRSQLPLPSRPNPQMAPSSQFQNSATPGMQQQAAQQIQAPSQTFAPQQQVNIPSSNYRPNPPPTQSANPPKQLGVATKQNVVAYVKSLPPIAQAIIKTESNGNPRAVSKAGAKGLMQLMPANLKKLGVRDPFDPEQNVMGGMKLIAEEMQRFGDLKLAVAAYNAGSPRILRAIQRANSPRWEDISRFLPRETREYVPKFLNNLQAVA